MPRGAKEPNGLTPCEMRFTQEYAVTGCATEAYDRAYDPPGGREISRRAGSRKLSQPHIRAVLELELARAGVTPHKVGSTIAQALDAQKQELCWDGQGDKLEQIAKEVPDHHIRLQAVKETCKIWGAYAARESTSRRVSLELHGEHPAVLDWILEHGRQPSAKERQAICSGQEEPQGELKGEIEPVDETAKSGSA